MLTIHVTEAGPPGFETAITPGTSLVTGYNEYTDPVNRV